MIVGSVLLRYSMKSCRWLFFFLLRDFRDGQFCFVSRGSMTVGFQCQSVLLCYEISKTDGFVIIN